MFANIVEDGVPHCPMVGCGKPCVPDSGTTVIVTFKPEALARAFMQGALDSTDGYVIVHKACVGQE